MKHLWKILLALWIIGGIVFVCVQVSYADGFNSRGVWLAVSSQTIPASGSRSFGVRDVTDRELPFNILAYATTTGDSLKLTITLYGMMSYLLADTTKIATIATTTEATTGSVIALGDTLDGETMYPYLYGKVTNNHASASAVVTLWLYMRPREINIVQ